MQEWDTQVQAFKAMRERFVRLEIIHVKLLRCEFQN